MSWRCAQRMRRVFIAEIGRLRERVRGEEVEIYSVQEV